MNIISGKRILEDYVEPQAKAPTPGSYIDELPNELIQIILKKVDDNKASALVCKKWHALIRRDQFMVIDGMEGAPSSSPLNFLYGLSVNSLDFSQAAQVYQNVELQALQLDLTGQEMPTIPDRWQNSVQSVAIDVDNLVQSIKFMLDHFPNLTSLVFDEKQVFNFVMKDATETQLNRLVKLTRFGKFSPMAEAFFLTATTGNFLLADKLFAFFQPRTLDLAKIWQETINLGDATEESWQSALAYFCDKGVPLNLKVSDAIHDEGFLPQIFEFIRARTPQPSFYVLIEDLQNSKVKNINSIFQAADYLKAHSLPFKCSTSTAYGDGLLQKPLQRSFDNLQSFNKTIINLFLHMERLKIPYSSQGIEQFLINGTTKIDRSIMKFMHGLHMLIANQKFPSGLYVLDIFKQYGTPDQLEWVQSLGHTLSINQ